VTENEEHNVNEFSSNFSKGTDKPFDKRFSCAVRLYVEEEELNENVMELP